MLRAIWRLDVGQIRRLQNHLVGDVGAVGVLLYFLPANRAGDSNRQRPMSLNIGLSPWLFTSVMAVAGVAMAVGKTSVFGVHLG